MTLHIFKLDLLVGRNVRFRLRPAFERFTNFDKDAQDYYGWIWSLRCYWLWFEFGITWVP